MRVAFRADASSVIGTGHVVRCLTLAQTLRERGAQVHFVCRDHPGHLLALLQHQAMPVTVLPSALPLPTTRADDYTTWLGVTPAQDADETIEALAGDRPDWLVVDHYGLDAAWERRLRTHVGQLMAIDDLTNRPHDVDVLLNQNYSDQGDNRYRTLVPATCRLLLGPRYALLRSEYAAYREVVRPRDGGVQRVLVFLGGSDPHNLSGVALEALAAPELRHLEVDLVVGVNSPHRAALERQARARDRTRVHGVRAHLADLIAQADLAIGAGGATTWERMCLGLPSIVVSIADNQRPACDALARAGLVWHAGPAADVRAGDLRRLIGECIASGDSMKQRSIQSRLAVDGRGALRVAEVIDPSAFECLCLRPAPKPSDMAQQFVVAAGALPVGEITFDRNGDQLRVDYALDELVRDRGWAPRLVSLAARHQQDGEPMALRAGGNRVSYLRFAGAPHTGFAISIVSDRNSWINDYLPELVFQWLSEGHRVLWVHDPARLASGDFCFYLSCGQIVPPAVLRQFRHNLVVHESDLPKGKGWSPLTWQILEGKDRIPVTLFEAVERVDAGPIYAQEWLQFGGHELIDELRAAQAQASHRLCRRFVAEYPQLVQQARAQTGESSVYRRRGPVDSRLDPARPLAEQFDLLRIVDNERYPAFFEHAGRTYRLAIRKLRH